MLRRSLLPILASFASACLGHSTAPTAHMVYDALLAEVGGPGGCSSLVRADTTYTSWFPEVKIVTGRCLREHGDTVASIVGVDPEGAVYLLDSPSAFRFLLRRHPPGQIPADSLVDYAWDALRFTGRVSPLAELEQGVGLAPGAQGAGDSSAGLVGPGSWVQRFPHGVEIIWVTTAFDQAPQTWGLVLEASTGDISIVRSPAQ